MTTPTNRELAERLRNWCRRQDFPSIQELRDIAAALEAMPEGDGQMGRLHAFVGETLADLEKERQQYITDRALGIEIAKRQVWVRNLYERVTGTPWTPPQPERVSDEELDKAYEIYSIYRDRGNINHAVFLLIEAERARRAGEGKK